MELAPSAAIYRLLTWPTRRGQLRQDETEHINRSRISRKEPQNTIIRSDRHQGVAEQDNNRWSACIDLLLDYVVASLQRCCSLIFRHPGKDNDIISKMVPDYMDVDYLLQSRGKGDFGTDDNEPKKNQVSQMSDDREVKTLVKEIRRQCEKRGWGSLKAMSVLFRGLDKDYSKRVDLREFIDGMRNYGIDMTEEQLGKVFRWCDKDHGGSIDFREFLQELLPPMAPCRKAVIEEVFRKLDATKDGVLKMDDLKIIYKDYAMNHPKVLRGEWTVDKAYQSFLDTFDDPKNRDGIVTLEEFMSYYSQVSMTVHDDAYFDMMMRNCWGLNQKKMGIHRRQ
ncbi:hypothetical protein LSH36_388g00002 [Paralvinella palmiformis]|uniref:EF-hand domain-containing protein n=1 Tax=Paralvinella palmiformis TaxID=53620 RepID=A0AAD9JDI8_9ANNE|nr:hypothetical protein LSH36_388g00002 [Paralvinella palmiformis]